MADGKWMQKAAASIKKRGTAGKCTPITKPSCTGKAKVLAKTFKKINKNKSTLRSGGMIKRADGSYSKRGLWDNIRANKGSGKKPTKAMLTQEKKIKAKK